MLASKLGYYSLIFGLILSFFLKFYSVYNLKYNNTKSENNLLSLLSLQFFFVFLSFLCLIFSFVKSDFSNSTVFNNSHTTKPLFYKISGTWGNHEGSLLLWLLVLTLFIFIFFLKSKNQPKNYRLLTILFQQVIISGFFLFLIITSNPFDYLFPVPKEGLGLNPILQDPALAIHPPILYLGYVGSSIIFSSSLAALTQSYIGKEWANHIKKWIFLSWIFLTLGIMLGSIWAYYELGWGGFWFWDPVENVSLMPWFCLTALIHTVIVLEKRFILQSWTSMLAIATFTLSMSGTFLVRSGILNSVHTFANDPERGIFILVFLFVLVFIALIIFFIFEKRNRKVEKNFFLLSKETAILVNNWFMMFFLSVVLIGTIYPIFLEVLTNEKISIGPPFYQKLMVPFLIPFLIFMGIGTNLKWIKNEFKKINLQQILLLIFSFAISFIIISLTDETFLFSTLLIGSGFYLLFVSIKDFKNKNNSFSNRVSHFAFSLLILSILFNGIFSKEFSGNMKIGDKIEFNQQKIEFKKIETKNEKNYKSLIGFFEIKDNENNVVKLNPEIRIYNQPKILTSEADIKTTIFSDKFIVINLLKDEVYFNVRYQIKSFMLLIWISTALLAVGGLFSFVRKKNK